MSDSPKTGPKNGPPTFGTQLLQWIYGVEFFNEIHGDFLELFEENLANKGRFQARWHYVKDALFSLRNLRIKRYPSLPYFNQFAMFENYFKITLRNIAKNKVYSVLNILGLALGIAACIFILQYVSYERSYDTFHAHYEDLYRIQYKVYRGNELNIDCAAAVPRVGPFMKEKMPEVREFARAFPTSGVISFEDQKFREERIHIVDPSFLKIFTFPLVSGDLETALTEPYTVVISESTARKYFGNQDPIGKMLQMDGEESMAVTAVAKDVPDNSHIKFDLLISYETLNNNTRNEDGESGSETSWGWYDFNSYVLLEPGTDTEDYDARFAEVLYDERGEAFEKYNFRDEFPLQAIGDIHLYSNLLQESEPEEQGDGQAVFFLTLIALFILLIAWINYINL
ncbi:MAG: ABC transporter permease, partial [Bacteroidota bacterium]